MDCRPPAPLLLDPLLAAFLREDLGHGDLTAEALFSQDATGRARFVAREPLVAAGLGPVCGRVFTLLDPAVEVAGAAPDGDRVEPGAVLLELRGPARSLLMAERVALNLAQRLSGIATLTAAFVAAVRPHGARICDTRKTTPGLRILEKYAVRCGGGSNHRFHLADGVLVKDNHIAARGSIAAAVSRLRQAIPHTLRIEVECDTLDQVRECLDAGVDIIMLDNMDDAAMARAVDLIAGQAMVEVSGRMTPERVARATALGADIISAGALTHSAPAVDIGMDWVD